MRSRDPAKKAMTCHVQNKSFALPYVGQTKVQVCVPVVIILAIFHNDTKDTVQKKANQNQCYFRHTISHIIIFFFSRSHLRRLLATSESS